MKVLNLLTSYEVMSDLHANFLIHHFLKKYLEPAGARLQKKKEENSSNSLLNSIPAIGTYSQGSRDAETISGKSRCLWESALKD